MKTDSLPWRLDATVGRLTAGPLELNVDLSQPSSGASDIALGGDPIKGALWAWSPVGAKPQRLVEAYVRGDDLIAEYSANEDFPFHTQAYWRVGKRENDTVALDLILSIRTQELDTHPVLTVKSTIAEGAIELLGWADSQDRPIGVWRHGEQTDWSSVETVQAGDLMGEYCLRQQGGVVEWRLFDHFLEKGVIRRDRLSIRWAADGWDRAQAAEVADELRSASTALTA